MASIKPSSRYNNNPASSFNSSTSRSPSSSIDTLLHITTTTNNNNSSSRALIKSSRTNTASNFSSMVKKFMETKGATSCSSSSRRAQKGFGNDPVNLKIAADFLAEDLKRAVGKKATPVSALHKKLFKSGKRDEEKKALTEVKGNARTLAMVLRSERELLSSSKEQEARISELKLKLEDKNREVEKLKDLCLKQREEIKYLKSAILFPDGMNSQLQELLEKQDSEIMQANQLIPNLQKQFTSLTGQLQCLAEDLAEVKADKYLAKGCFDNHSSPRTPTYDHEEATNSLEFSYGDQTTPGSPDDLFVKDLNPCLTPNCNAKSTEPEERDFSNDERLFRNNAKTGFEFGSTSFSRKLSRSSESCQCSKATNRLVSVARRSDESKSKYGRQKHHKLF